MSANIVHAQALYIQITALLCVHTKRERERERWGEGGGEDSDSNV